MFSALELGLVSLTLSCQPKALGCSGLSGKKHHLLLSGILLD